MKTKLLLIIALFLSSFIVNAQDIGFLGDFGNWGDDVNMTTTDNITYTKTGYYFPTGGLKFRQDDAWDINWGGDTFPTGTSTGGNIPVTVGFYDVTFDIVAGTYNFVTASPSDQNVSIIGDFNAWAGDVVLSTTDNINYTATEVLLAFGGLKFRRDANWAVGYGGAGLTGTADLTAGNISIPSNVNYDISFNIETLAYSITESVLSTEDFENNLNIFFANSSLNINGYLGKANIKAYDILGKLIESKENVQISSSFSTTLNLPKNQLSIIVIEADNFNKVLNYPESAARPSE